MLVLPKCWTQAFFAQALFHSAFINALHWSFASKRFVTACHKHGLQGERLKNQSANQRNP